MKRNKIVCLDTQVLIWGFREESSPGQEEMVARAKFLLKKLDHEKAKILIPSICLAEASIAIEFDKREEFFSLFNKNFRIVNFDQRAAIYFANHFKFLRFARMHNCKANPLPKEKLKTDYMVVAIALAQQADVIYSHDNGHIKIFANDFIKVESLPELEIEKNPQQPTLPEENESIF